jgi:hypothetical protein
MGASGRPPRAAARRPSGEGQFAQRATPRRTGRRGSAWRSMVAVLLEADNARLLWSKTPMPALMNLLELAHVSAFAGVDRERILYDFSAPTALERADGN